MVPFCTSVTKVGVLTRFEPNKASSALRRARASYPRARTVTSRRAMVSASAAQKKRVTADKKMQSNVTKRGLVTDPSVERREGKLGVGPMMIAFFLFVVVGSSLLQVVRSASSDGR
jgi:hypothetical protein